MSVKLVCGPALSEVLEARRLFAGTITGRVLNDANGDSFHNANETGQANYPVYVDLNKNNAYDGGDLLAYSDATGTFKLTNVPTGSYVTVRPLPASGYLNTGNSGWSMMLTDSKPDFVEGDMFSVTQKSMISGRVGRTGEDFPGLEGQLVYIDGNNNSRRDAGEQFTVTQSAGIFQLGGLDAGTYQVRVDPSADLGPVTATPGPITVSGRPVRYNAGLISVNAPAGPTIGVYQSDGVTDRLTHVTFVPEGGSLDFYVGNSTGTTGTYQWDTNYVPGQPFTPDVTGTHLAYPNDPFRDGNSTTFIASRLIASNGVTGPTHVTIVDVVNVPPTGSFSGSTTQVGQAASVAFANVTDPSAADAAALTYSYDFNNDGVFDLIGSASSTATLPATQANTPGVYTVRGRITDKDGGYTDYSTTVTVLPPPNGTIQAVLFNDLDGDGTQESGESGLSGRTVFLDADNDNVIDAGEPTLITDDNGQASFSVAAGSYNVRQVLPAGWRFTNKLAATVGVVSGATADVSLGSQVITAYDSGMSGTLFNDTNGNGVQDTGESPLAGRTVFDDRNNNGLLDTGERSNTSASNGFYFIGTYEPGAHVVRQLLPAGWQQTSPTNDAGYAVDVSAHISFPNRNFGSRLIPPTDPTVTLEAETAALSGGTVRATQHAGFTGTGYADLGGTNSAIKWTVNRNAAGTASLELRYANGGTGDRPVSVLVNNVTIGTLFLSPTGGWSNWKSVSINANLIAGANAISVVGTTSNNANVDNLTLRTGPTPPPPAPASISGFVFDDADKDGLYDTDETRPTGRTVFLDANNNGALDAGETSVLTGTNGAFGFANLAAGTYRVREVLPTNTAYSTALADVTVAAGQVVNNVAIGVKATTVVPPPTGTAGVSGIVYNDNNKNGKFDTGDGYAKGVVVFLDADNDGKLDAGEANTLTDDKGKYSFANLAAGTYRVRRTFPTAGYTYSTPLLNPTLTAGQVKTGQSIGTKKV